MAQVKVNKLSGAVLDWAVAKCEGATDEWHTDNPFFWCGVPCVRENGHDVNYTPSTNCTQSWPIIEREMREHGFDLWSGAHVPTGQFAATYCRGAPDSYVYGPTPLIAAMRCYVASKLGDVVEVPDELIK